MLESKAETTERRINPAMITLARESRSLTQTELADQIGISQALQSKCESGLKYPSDDLLGKWSAALRYPSAFFYQTDPIYGAGLSEFYHRKRQDVAVRDLARVHAAINIVRMQIARLLRAVEHGPCKIRPLDMEEFKNSPSQVARAVRAMWQLPAGPIANVIAAIEDAGGIVIRYPFGNPRIDAISRWVPGLPPLFFVNEGLPTDRERLTLCHELGHLFMHDVPTGAMEAEANEFASEFLMPAREVAPHLDHITLERLAILKPYWRVSMAALLYRAEFLRKVSRRTAQFLWMAMAKRGYKRAEPSTLDLAAEKPTALNDLVQLHRQHFGYGLDEFCEMLAADARDLSALYGLSKDEQAQRASLRVIK